MSSGGCFRLTSSYFYINSSRREYSSKELGFGDLFPLETVSMNMNCFDTLCVQCRLFLFICDLKFGFIWFPGYTPPFEWMNRHHCPDNNAHFFIAYGKTHPPAMLSGGGTVASASSPSVVICGISTASPSQKL